MAGKLTEGWSGGDDPASFHDMDSGTEGAPPGQPRHPRHFPVIVTTFGLVIAILVAELGTRMAFRRSMDLDMEMWKYATLLKEPSPDPQLGHRHRASARAFLMGAEIRTNSLGIRGAEVEVPKPAGTFRIVLMGDSFTMGWGVAESATCAEVLERRLNERPPNGLRPASRYEVVNLGVGNYNTVQEVALLRGVGLGLDPDLIIVGSFINDAEPVASHRASLVLNRSYLAAFIASRLNRLPLGGAGSLGYLDYYRRLYVEESPGRMAMRMAWSELGSISKATGIPAIVYLLPELHSPNAAYPFADIHASLRALGAESGVPVIDLLPAFAHVADAGSLWVSPGDPHPNALANAIIAGAIYQTIGSQFSAEDRR